MPTYVQMDNSGAVEHYKEHPDAEEIQARPLEGERIFEIVFPDPPAGQPRMTLREMIATTMATYRKHQAHGNAPDDAPVDLVTPKWIRSNDDQLEAQLVDEYQLEANDIPAGFGAEHESWDRTSMPALKVTSAVRGSAGLLTTSLYVLAAASLFRLSRLQLRTTAGRDYQAGIMGNPSSNGTGSFASASYIGVTADTTTPAAGDTILPGEIISGTLIRAQGAFGHTTGASSYTLSKLFVSDQSISIYKIGIFNAATGGSPFIETVLSAVATLNSGDQLQVVSTVTL
jgi:hypothetical protein